jgi:hypothetical protein
MSENDSDSIEQDEIIKKIITHKFPKSNRPGSQLFPKTPELRGKPILKSLNPSKKSSPLTSPKPRSGKASAVTPSNINQISKQTSQEIIRSIYTLVSSKLPITLYESSELSVKDQEEIQAFFIQQKAKFKKTLETFAKRDLSQNKFVGHSKSLKIIESKYLQEVKRLKEKQKIVKKELIKKTSERIFKEKTTAKKNKELEVKKKKTEEKKIQGYEKDLIMKNIENFYKDKTNLVKEYFKAEVERNKVQSLEEKQLASEFVKEMKMNSSKKFSDLKIKYDLEIERLKEKFNNISSK